MKERYIADAIIFLLFVGIAWAMASPVNQSLELAGFPVINVHDKTEVIINLTLSR